MEDLSKKRYRKIISLDTKVKIIKLSDEGVSNTKIARTLNLARTSICTVVKSRDKILEAQRAATAHTTIIRKRYGLIADMEALLIKWIEDQIKKKVQLSQLDIRRKAQDIFIEIRGEKGEDENDVEFCGSRGWYIKFKKRYNLHINKKIEETENGERFLYEVEGFDNYEKNMNKDGLTSKVSKYEVSQR